MDYELKNNGSVGVGVSKTAVSGDSSTARVQLTDEESLMLRFLMAGHTQKQICRDLRMDSGAFHRLVRDLQEKIGTADPSGLRHEFAKCESDCQQLV
jgi:hypothetical protein